MTHLVIDIGNTLTKVAVFELDQLVQVNQFEIVEADYFYELLDKYKVTRAIVSSVKKNTEAWLTDLEAKVPLVYFNNLMTSGIKNHYLTPGTLGTDRLAAVIGASHLYPGQNSLVITGGTCITYDYVDSGANYFGGSISPGLNMRYKAVNNYTAGLPLINADTDFNAAYGNNTETAIRSGVQNGIKYELTGFIESYKAVNNQLNIVLSGGDSIFFDRLLKNSIFAPYIKNEPYLVLKGLNAAIQKHND
ncbi:type III pantothenate kinase [Mucilaginibacter flavus]|uniref:type III pantothenate kinase n=1 Tax=Mucilaginibacter flavus TaxID=931504 RepID=UPI0025B434B6|nr:type III pantothenate kinase [Mucilaginibacter flavus]MDN3581143.1 type III pantothenate kinase [Mucilaginibacter flavus]